MTRADDRERWLRLSRLFDRALDLDADARSALLREECADDPDLRAQLERMLAADAAASALDAGAAAWIKPNHPHPDADDDPRHAAGERVGGWRLERVIGRGGMGTVFAAHRDDGDTRQQAAIKYLHRRWDGSLQAQRFLQERRILAMLSHPNIPGLLDHGLDDEGRPWFALQYVDGEPLTEWADVQRLSLTARIDLFRQACSAVQHAHERFVVHRDLKPANILADREGHAHVLDFGVAKRMDEVAGATRTGFSAGFTPEYAAPEQISGGTISAATDVYALGVVLYQLLAGRLPYAFQANNIQAAAEAISGQQATRLDQAIGTGTDREVAQRLAERRIDLRGFRSFARGDLSRILQTALAKEPERRYPSVQAFSADLLRFLQGRPVSVTGDTFAYRAGKFVTRNRWGVAMGGVAAIVLVVGLSGIVMQTRQARAEAARANQETARAEVQARRAIAARDFLFEILGRGSPEASGNRHAEITVSEALGLARDRLDQTLQRDPDLGADLSWLIASVHTQLGENDKGRELLEPALEAVGDDTAPEIRARIHSLYARTLMSSSELATAEPHARRAIELLQPGGPSDALANAHEMLSTILILGNRHEASLIEQQRATNLYIDLHGSDSPQANASRIELSYFLSARDRHEEAIDAAAAAVDAFTDLHPDATHPDVTHALWSLGNALNAAGRPREALEPLRQALPMVRDIYGADSTKFARSLQLLGRSEIDAGDFGPGLEHSRQAVELYRRQAPDHPLLGALALAIGDGLLATGDPQAAIAVLEAASNSARPQGNPDNAARLAIMLARARIEAGDRGYADDALPRLIATLEEAGSSQLPAALLTDALRLRHQQRFEQARERLDRIATDGASIQLRAALALERALLAEAEADLPAAGRYGSQALALLEARQADKRPEYARAHALAAYLQR